MDKTKQVTIFDHYGFKILVGCLINFFLLWFILRDIQWSEVKLALSRARFELLFPIVGLLALFLWIKVVRWKLLLIPVCNRTIRELFPIMMAGVAVNMGISIFAGEFLRSYLLGLKYQVSRLSIFVTVFLERLIDVLILLTILACLLEFSDFKFHFFWLGFSLFLVVILISGLFAFAIWKDPSLHLLGKWTHWIPHFIREKALHKIELAIQGLLALSKPRLLFMFLILSIFQWLIMATVNYAAITTVGIHVPFTAALFIVAINAFVIALPSSPGYIGAIEFSYVIGLKAFSVDASDALAAAIIFHVIYIATILIFSIPSLKLYKRNSL